MEKNVIRILLLGKTGVGKSSFINYFLGVDAAKTGVGEPCTQELTKYTLNEWEDCTIELYDSKGLEVLDADNWTSNIIDEVENSSRREFEDRYHTIFYCISAKKKIEIFEENLLRDLQKAAKQQIHIILTHCDDIEEETLYEREEYLKDKISDTICIYRIISINKKKRNGSEIKKSGREAVVNGVFDVLWNDMAVDIADSIAREYVSQYDLSMSRFKIRLHSLADMLGPINLIKLLAKSIQTGNFSMNEFENKTDEIATFFENEIERLKQDIGEYSETKLENLERIYNSYSQIADNRTMLGGDDISEICQYIMFDRIEDAFDFGDMDLDDFLLRNVRLGKAMENLDDIDDDSIGGTLKAFGSAGLGFLTLKKDLSNMIDEVIWMLKSNVRHSDIKNELYSRLIEKDFEGIAVNYVQTDENKEYVRKGDEARDLENFSEAVEWYRKAAENGDSRGQNELGMCHMNGAGVEQDYYEALKWFIKSAEQGYVPGQGNTGACYYYGMGIEKDYNKAFEWFTKADEQEYSFAQYMLGRCYKNGNGVMKNDKKAFEYFEKAAKQELDDAQFLLGECYYYGYGVEKNIDEALKWYRKAADQDNEDAIERLNEIQI